MGNPNSSDDGDPSASLAKNVRHATITSSKHVSKYIYHLEIGNDKLPSDEYSELFRSRNWVIPCQSNSVAYWGLEGHGTPISINGPTA